MSTTKEQFYSLVADVVLVIHFAFVLFVLASLLAIWAGRIFRWSWVRNFWFRLAHVLCIGVVVAESVCGMTCPLTTWETKLRVLAGGGQRYEGSFMQHWIHRVMFFEASERTFTVIYVVFFAAVLASFWWVTPRWPGRSSKLKAQSPKLKKGRTHDPAL